MTVAAQFVAFFKTSLKKIIPRSIIDERGIIVRLGRGSGRIYAQKRLLAAIGMNSMNKRSVPINTRSFVFVCFGNIMRSPMADALLRQAAAETKLEFRSDSAGLHAIPGKSAHPWAQTAASEMGISLADHQAKLLTSQMMEQADAVFAMDLQNLAELLNLYPQHRDRIFMLSAYADTQLREIPDPYFGDLDTTRQCYRVLNTCVRNVLARAASAVAK
jgi:protein-tyrosine phosphatase